MPSLSPLHETPSIACHDYGLASIEQGHQGSVAWSIAFPRPTLVLMIAKGVSKRDRMQYSKHKTGTLLHAEGLTG